jgi:transposase
VRAEGGGKPLTFAVSPGQRHDAMLFERLMRTGGVRRRGVGRPRRYPRRLVADRGYSYPRIRRWLQRHRIRVTIARRKDQPRHGPFDAAEYRLRARVEQLFCRLKQFRRIATRYEKRAANYLAMLWLAAIVLWL